LAAWQVLLLGSAVFWIVSGCARCLSSSTPQHPARESLPRERGTEHLRDRPKLKVTLQWNMTVLETKATLGLVRVTNIGRRPIHLGIVALTLPKGYKNSHLILNDSIKGTRLEEGGKPEGFMITYDRLSEYRADWDKIRAMTEDSTGKAYFSEYPKAKPSWAS
jgi:hypothetical protein